MLCVYPQHRTKYMDTRESINDNVMCYKKMCSCGSNVCIWPHPYIIKGGEGGSDCLYNVLYNIFYFLGCLYGAAFH